MKTRPNPGDPKRLLMDIDATGYDYIRRVLVRAEPKRGDDVATFRQAKERVMGLFFAGGSIMGWKVK